MIFTVEINYAKTENSLPLFVVSHFIYIFVLSTSNFIPTHPYILLDVDQLFLSFHADMCLSVFVCLCLCNIMGSSYERNRPEQHLALFYCKSYYNQVQSHLWGLHGPQACNKKRKFVGRDTTLALKPRPTYIFD